MTRASSVVMGTTIAALAWLAAPGAASAQYDYQCADQSQCPAGTACVNGTCVQQQQPYPQQQQPYPQQQQPYGAQPYPQQQPMGHGPPPQEPRTEGRHLVGLIVAGAVVWAASYAFNAFVGAFAGAFTICGGSTICPDESEWEEFRGFGFVPLIGPWMQLAAKPTPFGHDTWGGYLIGNAVLQTAGLTMLILGATIEVETRVYGEGPGDGLELALLPQLGPTQGGLQLVGRF